MQKLNITLFKQLSHINNFMYNSVLLNSVNELWHEPTLIRYLGPSKFLRKIMSRLILVWGWKNGKNGIIICFPISHLKITTIYLLKKFPFQYFKFFISSGYRNFILVYFSRNEWTSENLQFIFSFLTVGAMSCKFSVNNTSGGTLAKWWSRHLSKDQKCENNCLRISLRFDSQTLGKSLLRSSFDVKHMSSIHAS